MPSMFLSHVMAAFSCSAATPDPAPPGTAADVDRWAMKAAIPGSCIAAGSPMPSIPPDNTQHDPHTQIKTQLAASLVLSDIILASLLLGTPIHDAFALCSEDGMLAICSLYIDM